MEHRVVPVSPPTGEDGGMAFSGFGRDALAFFAALEGDNSKACWTAHLSTFETDVRIPMKAFAEEVDASFRPLVIFRPHRDVRFAKDKSPYKTHIGAVGELEGGSIVYVQLSSRGLMAACGYYMMATDQLERYRAAVADDQTGPQLESAIAAVKKAKLTVSHGGGEPLKTAPRGYSRDHPRIGLLQWKGVIASRDFGSPSWLHGVGVLKQVQQVWRSAAPLCSWLDTHVGPSTLIPDDRR